MTSQSHSGPEAGLEGGSPVSETDGLGSIGRANVVVNEALKVVRSRLRTRRAQVLAAAFIVVLIGGAWLRFSGANWDEGQHLNPDERYISSLDNNLRWPSSLVRYFDVHDSPLSPYNIDEGRSYVYGTLPLFATKFAATLTDRDVYGEVNIVGRHLSALVDTGTMVLVFLTALLVLREFGRQRAVAGALVAAALYAFTVTAIQHAHFFTVDSWVTFFGLLTIYLAARELHSPLKSDTRVFSLAHALVGTSLGLTVACKVGGSLVIVPVLVALVGKSVLVARRDGKQGALLRFGGAVLTLAVSSYLAFRATSPYVFANSSWLDLSLNGDFRSALTAQARGLNGASLYPPAYQWLLTPRLWGPLENLVRWQLGIPLGIAAVVGLAVLAVRISRRSVRLLSRGSSRPPAASAEELVTLTTHVMIVSFVAVVFLYFGSRFAHTGRYLLPVVPFLAIAAAYGVTYLLGAHRRLFFATSLVLVCLTGVYALAFHHIYRAQNTRVAASEWLNQHVPAGETIANEHWDDGLPTGGIWIDPATGSGPPGAHRGVTVPVFDPDDETKLRKLYDSLSGSDYYVLSSPRAWNTIGRLPNLFPFMPRFYRELFAGRLGFRPVAEFRSEPSFLGIRINDLSAEEAFWVYDHPPVKIFRREGPMKWQAFRATLCQPPAPSACG